MIPAAMFGAEVSRVRAVIVMHGPYMIPRPDIPPLGTGWMPGKGPLGRAARPVRRGGHARGLPQLDAGPQPHPRRGGAAAGAGPAGPDGRGPTGYWSAPAPATISDPARCWGMSAMSGPSSMTRRAAPPPARGPGRPPAARRWWAWSSTVMRQEGLLQRAADALGQLPVRGLVSHHRPGSRPGRDLRPGQCHGHPVGTPR